MELRRNDCLVTHKIFRNDILATVCFTCNNNMSQRGTEKLIVNEKGIGSQTRAGWSFWPLIFILVYHVLFVEY